MTDPGGWTTPDGWGPPTPPAPSPAPAQPPVAGPGQPPPGWGAPRVEVRPGVVPLRPLGLGEVLDGAVGVVRRYARPALGLAAAVAVVTTVIDVVLLLTAFSPFLEVDPTALENGETAALEDALGGAFAGGALSVLLALLSGAVLTGAMTAVVGKAVLGEPFGFAQAWAQVRPLLLRLVGLALLVLAIVYGTLLLSVAAGVAVIAATGAAGALVGVPLVLGGCAGAAWLYVRYSLAPCALVLERVGIGASLKRSAVLVKRDWWRVFGILALTFLIGGFVAQVVQLPFAVLGAGSPTGLFDPEADVLGTRSLVLTSIGGGIASTLVSPFTAGVRALLYVDRRMRAEGLDVSLAAAAAARS